MTFVKEIISFIEYSEKLKCVHRSGWILTGIETSRFESVAEHSYGTVMISIIIAQSMRADGYKVDVERVAIIAALHDLPESITGDIARTQQFLKNEEKVRAKKIAEDKVIEEILGSVCNSIPIMHQLWKELTIGESLEVKIVKGADIIDMLVHARSLEKKGESPQKLHQFFSSSQSLIDAISLDLVTKIYNELYKAHEDEAKKQGFVLD